ncbi:hypothetical protein C5167_043772 [Papaver somniferum]|uniref:Uncharacterized protein n=1 Tax=Papaver somniferum TaxID=3469 RepID=A0A4Y7L8B5_PAPSO|nr:hypothetical protein C5167_043772 [Papaver somniferum]
MNVIQLLVSRVQINLDSQGLTEVNLSYMRGTTGLSRGKYILKQINLIRQSMGMYTTSIQKKGNNEITKEGPVTGNIHEPILAFNKPQLPPDLIGRRMITRNNRTLSA